ncbi:hypothetical protein ES703_95847 [subsurface metagenome]
MTEFRINEFLSLRLEGEETIIYVARARFIQCTFLLLNIRVDEISTFDEIESIDEAAEKLDTSMEDETIAYKFEIPPKVEFWGHCSNLQVWYEHDYDTRLIHSNLAFPLLRKLTEAGDPLAKKVFKEEIVKRYKNGTDATREFLEAERFLRYLSLDERMHLILNDDDFAALQDLSEEISENQTINTLLDRTKIETNEIIKLDLRNFKLQKFPRSILKFKALEVLSLRNNKLRQIPQDIDRLSKLKELWLSNNKLVNLPNSVCKLKNLEKLWLDKNHLKRLPNNLGKLLRLKTLQVSNNSLIELQDSICKLKELKDLFLANNHLTDLPKYFTQLTSLKYLNLKHNSFTEYPPILKELHNLTEVKINFS